MADEIRAIDLQRLHVLEKQAAHYGPNTDPAVLIEIQDLRNKYPDAPRNGGAQRQPFDTTALMNTLGATLVRLRTVEERNERADDKLDTVVTTVGALHGWMQATAVVAIVALVLALIIAVKVF